ncbi:hypothetical protein PNO31109_03846 [Pandoraea nosoerga]|uniref:Uncharacterized protein n=1 Tax=Pandoraea nosoerga TaxID=2508296 RepID=A0A5E4XG59_9BURK|nr:hypothetical protein PNO31109_03846 [Pandoraea nosoerga]
MADEGVDEGVGEGVDKRGDDRNRTGEADVIANGGLSYLPPIVPAPWGGPLAWPRGARGRYTAIAAPSLRGS